MKILLVDDNREAAFSGAAKEFIGKDNHMSLRTLLQRTRINVTGQWKKIA